MRIAFTLCSNNYLAQAKILVDSLSAHNPNYRIVIGLVDRKHQDVDYTLFLPHEIIPIEEIGIAGFDDLAEKYNIVELNTAVKPFFFKFIFQAYPAAKSVMYFDPDIMLFGNLKETEQQLNGSNIVLTPHILTPVGIDEYWPQETTFLMYGIYNLGFLAISNEEESLRFLNWWAERTFHKGYRNRMRGMFVDQLWMNLVTVFFADITISRNLGMNMAHWNLHERRLSLENETWIVNGAYPLIFFHFSGYDPLKPSSIAVAHNRFSFETRPDIVELFSLYQEMLLANNYLSYQSVKCYFAARGKMSKLLSRRASTFFNSAFSTFRRYFGK